jgi:hypothetical protein
VDEIEGLPFLCLAADEAFGELREALVQPRQFVDAVHGTIHFE